MRTSTLSGIVVGSSGSITLLGTTYPFIAWDQTEQHPSFMNALNDTIVKGGWGKQDHYFHEVDTNGRSIIGPAEDHRTIYVSENAATNWGEQDIADAQFGGNTAAVTGAYLEGQSLYGHSPSAPLDRQMAARLRARIVTRPSRQSIWWMFERGYSYGSTAFLQRGASGHSPLHPYVIDSYGSGDRPVLGVQELHQDNEQYVFMRGVETEGGRLNGLDTVMCEDVVFTGHEVESQGCSHKTFYRCGFLNGTRTEPANGSDNWSDTNANRSSCIFVDDGFDLLMHQNWAWHGGWVDGFDNSNWLWNNGQYGQPPNLYSHNIYIQKDMMGCTVTENVSMEPASSHIQFRSGGYYWYNTLVDGNIAGNIPAGRDAADAASAGAPLTGDQVGSGNYSSVLYNLTTSAKYLSTGIGDGSSTAGAPNWGWDGGGNGVDALIKSNIAAHAMDPNNPSEITAKTNIRATSRSAYSFFGKEYMKDGNVQYNWVDQPDEGVDGISETVLNAHTVQKYAEDVLGLVDTTTRGFAEYVVAHPTPWIVGFEFNEWMRAGFGLPPAKSSRTVPTTVTFVPNVHAEGFLYNNPLNWSTGYLPIDGDTLVLASNDVYSATATIEVPSISFGQGNTLYVSGGRIRSASVDCGAAGAGIAITHAGQFHLNGYDAANVLSVDVLDGRFYNYGDVAQGIDITGGGFAELVLVTGGKSFEVATGRTLTLNGEYCLCGADGITGGGADLVLAGTLDINPVSGSLPTIRKFRSGMYGTTPTDVTFNVSLSGSLTVDLSGVPSGTYTIIQADAITGTFSSTAFTNGSATVAYSADQVTITVS